MSSLFQIDLRDEDSQEVQENDENTDDLPTPRCVICQSRRAILTTTQQYSPCENPEHVICQACWDRGWNQGHVITSCPYRCNSVPQRTQRASNIYFFFML